MLSNIIWTSSAKQIVDGPAGCPDRHMQDVRARQRLEEFTAKDVPRSVDRSQE